MNTMNTIRRMLLALCLATLAMAACEQDGSMERAGEKMDRAVDRAGEDLRDVGERTDR
jgi:hypothetical protein